MFPEHTVQYSELLPGRLLHVRVESSPCLDLVVGYQHAWNVPRKTEAKAKATDHLLEKRAEFWAQLSGLLSSLPVRNQLLLLGDLNTSLTTEGSIVGRGIHLRQGVHAPDAPTAQDIFRSLDLTVLNSWGPMGLRACTYIPAGPTGHSQIDFAVMRRCAADPLARCAAPQLLPFVPTTGVRHLPLVGSVPCPAWPAPLPRSPVIHRRQVQDLCRLQPDLPERFQTELERLTAAEPALTANSLISKAWTTAIATLPRCLPLGQRPVNTRPVLTLWRLRTAVRELTPLARTSLRHLLRLWHCKSALQVHQRELKRSCRQAKKQRFNSLLQEAAESAPGLQRVYQLLRVFAPKSPKRRLQL